MALNMELSPLAGKRAPQRILVDLAKLRNAYYLNKPDFGIKKQQVLFGTSGHRGSSLETTFNENHILAISQAICDWKSIKSINGPLFLGKDTHALSEPAMKTALEVFAKNDVNVIIQGRGEYTPTPAISFAILTYNAGRERGLADGVVLTPSHNPPGDGGIKYNPPEGGPADTSVTGWIQERANTYLAEDLSGVRRTTFEKAMRSDRVHKMDLVMPYVKGLIEVLDMEAIRASKAKIGIDPMGGSAVEYWPVIADHYKLNLTVLNKEVDPTFSFMFVDWDGKIRMDCSSPFAMAGLIARKSQFDYIASHDTDGDRHGIVDISGLMEPNQYLATAIWYLFGNRPGWPVTAGIGKTIVSSNVINRVADHLGREIQEFPVGFKWFTNGLLTGNFGFAGEESAGACFLRRNGRVWVTEKDGPLMDLLAAEIMARTSMSPSELFKKVITRAVGKTHYKRSDSPIDPADKEMFKKVTPDCVKRQELGGDPIREIVSAAPANNAPIGGVKIITENGWIAVRPSGTEDVLKVYGESFRNKKHLGQLQKEAQEIAAEAIEEAKKREEEKKAKA